MNLTERRKAATELELARIAAALFAERGSDDTTAEAIAERAGMSVRTFFRYFRTKQEAVAPLLSFGAQRWRQHLSDLPREVPLTDALEQATAAAMADCENSESFAWTRGLLRAAEGDPALGAVWAGVNQESERRLVPLLADRAGTDDLHIALTAGAATAAIRIAVETWALSDDRTSPTESLAERAITCMRALTAGLRLS
ncbi:TetR family transcriptional regulator [Streptomyces sp. NPDC093064]|uniref:TetR family transcriptional regulator n=1 Tax=Streptomyces sp. NPDC093064 TaxID=3366020 RepID=UPI00380D3FF8